MKIARLAAAALTVQWAAWACPQAAAVADVLSPDRLKCEMTVDPLGVDVAQPRLSWIVVSKERDQKQVAYQVLVATTVDRLKEDGADLWDSGKVESRETLGIAYGGKPLASSQKVYWTVRVWRDGGEPSAWSKPAVWTMGVMKPNDWRGLWIVAPWASESVIMRRDFKAGAGIERAVVHICGLGQYELRINGQKVGENVLAPGWSKYNKTCLYETHDVTAQIREGDNAIGVMLGDGMFNTERRGRFSKFQAMSGPLRARGQLEITYADGRVEVVPTDTKWRVDRGPVTYNDIYGGEDYDARLWPKGWDEPGFDDAAWPAAVELVRPSGVLRGLSASAPPLREIESRKPIAVKTLSDSMDVVDFGQNAGYMPRIRVVGPAGSTVRLTHAEVVNDDGTINRSTCGGNRGPAYWQYTKRSDDAETWFPRFFYAGCRYLQVDKIPVKPGGELPRLESIEGVVVHSSAEPVGTFECSDELLNQIHTLVRWAQRSNMVSVLTDCPHREKLGWLEQYHLQGPSVRYEFDVSRIFAKGMRDMADSQQPTGLVPNIAPEYMVFDGTFRAAAEWGASFIVVPWQQYLFTGDVGLIREHYDEMRRYMDYLATRADGHLVDEGLGDWYDMGPKKPGAAQLTPPQVTATAHYYLDARMMAKFARLLERPADVAVYDKLADEIRDAWRAKFRRGSGIYGTGSQTSQAIALAMDLALPEDRDAALNALVEEIRKNGNSVTAGDVGYEYVLRALAGSGRSDAVLDILQQREKPGYAYILASGATALTEAWDANRGASQNHFIMGNIIEWMYSELVGIRPDAGGPGFAHVIVAPSPVGDLTWARGTYRSVRGDIAVAWKRTDKKFELDVEIPANVEATVMLPTTETGSVLQDGQDLGARAKRKGTVAEAEIPSGAYHFESALP